MARKDPHRLRDEAANAVARGKHTVALELYTELEQLEPAAPSWPKRIGEAHRRLGDNDAAIEAFQRAIDKYVGDGLLVQAIGVCKMILQIAPTNVHAATRLAELAMPSPAELRAVQATRAKAAPPRPLDAMAVPIAESRVELRDPGRDAARKHLAAGEERGVARTPVARVDLERRRAKPVTLPPGGALDTVQLADIMPDSVRIARDDGSHSGVSVIPIEVSFDEISDGVEIEIVDPKRAALLATPVLGQLPQATLETMIERMTLVDLAPGAVLFCEGEPGATMYVVVDGEVIVETNEHELARLGSGSFFGEIALVTDLPRSATVRAVGRVELLAIDRELLGQVAADIIPVLLGFVRDRLVDRITRTSELFEPFTDDERTQLAGQFEILEVDAGTRLITQGTRADGLYIVMAGKVDVIRGGSTLATLSTGDVFGEMSLLAGRGSTADVTTATRLLALRMPAKTFREMIMTYPQVLAYLGELSSKRSLLKQAEDMIDLHIDML